MPRNSAFADYSQCTRHASDNMRHPDTHMIKYHDLGNACYSVCPATKLTGLIRPVTKRRLTYCTAHDRENYKETSMQRILQVLAILVMSSAVALRKAPARQIRARVLALRLDNPRLRREAGHL